MNLSYWSGHIKRRIEDRKSSIPTSSPNGNALVFGMLKGRIKGRIEQGKPLNSFPTHSGYGDTVILNDPQDGTQGIGFDQWIEEQIRQNPNPTSTLKFFFSVFCGGFR